MVGEKISPSGTLANLETSPPSSGGGGVEKIWVNFEFLQVVLSSLYFSWCQKSEFQNNLNRSQLKAVAFCLLKFYSSDFYSSNFFSEISNVYALVFHARTF